MTSQSTQSDESDFSTSQSEDVDIVGVSRPLDLEATRIEIPALKRETGRQKHEGRILAFPSFGSEGLLVCRPKINGKKVQMIIDSGAAECICTLGFYESLPEPRPKLNPTEYRFTIANGEVMPALGVCHMRMDLAGETVTVKFFVSDCRDNLALLGMSYYRQARCAIHTYEQKLSYADGREVELHQERLLGSFLLRSIKPITVPKHGYTVVNTDVDSVCFNDEIEGKPIICQSSNTLWDESGVDSVDGYTTIWRGKARLVLRNLSGHAVIIPKGKIVGEAFGCDEATIIGDAFEQEINPKVLEKYAKSYCQSAGDKVPKVLAAYLAKEEEDLYMSVGEDPPDDENEDPEKRHSRHEDEMFAPLSVPLVGPAEEDGIPVHIKEMVDQEVLNNPDLSVDFKEKAKDFFIEMKGAFFDKSKSISQTDYAYHYVHTEGDKPVAYRPRRVPIGMKETVEEEIAKMLKDKIIKDSDSPWASPIVLVKKKDGTIRFCVDYRGVNNITRKDAYPLPRIEDYLDSFDGADTFCTLDLASGYWQVKMAEADKCKTAFTSHRGLFEFNVMPFGLCNAPATFQRMMDRLLGDLKHICLVYLDDIIVRGKGAEDCLANLKIVMDRIQAKGLKLKPKKCSFFQKSVNFLGHIVSGEGIATDPAKIAKVEQWPTPTRVGHVRSFLGLACYYQRFIKNYAFIARPLCNLLSKKSVFKWENEEAKAFQALKDSLTSSPVLGFPTPDGRYILDTDASKVAIGAVLSQVQGEGDDMCEKVIAYGSKTLNDAQVNYCTTKRELFAVFYFCCHKFRHYLAMTDFDVRTDHSALTWLQNFVGDDALTNRWKVGLSQFGRELHIIHRPGAQHGNADACSRAATRLCSGEKPSESERVCPFEQCQSCVEARLKKAKRTRSVRKRPCEYNTVCRSTGDFIRGEVPKEDHYGNVTPKPTPVNMMFMASESTVPDVREQLKKCVWICDSLSEEQIRGFQADDLVVGRFIDLLEGHKESKPQHKDIEGDSNDVKKMCMQWTDFILKNGVLYKRPKSGDVLRIVAPRKLRDTIIAQMHDFGHLGIVKTLCEMQKRFYWIRMKADVIRWIRCCRICAKHKTKQPRTVSPLKQELSGSRNERIAFDIIGPLAESTRGNRFILVIIDYFTKWVEASALSRHTAKIVANELFEKWITRFGVPLKIHSDQAPEFNSALMKEFCKLIDTCKTRTAPYRPQSNGLVERTNQSLEGILRCLVEDERSTWDDHLGTALMAYRSTIQRSIGATPNMMVYGEENSMPIDLMFRPPEWWEKDNYTPGRVDCTSEYVTWLRKSIQNSYARARKISKASAERQKKDHDVNTTVRSFNVGDWVLHWHKPTAARTLSQGWRDPMVVTAKVSPVTYEISKGQGETTQRVHIDTLVKDVVKPWRENWLRKALPMPSSETEISRTNLEVATPSDTEVNQGNLVTKVKTKKANKTVRFKVRCKTTKQVKPSSVFREKKQNRKRGRPRKVATPTNTEIPEDEVIAGPTSNSTGRPSRTRRPVIKYQGVFLCNVHRTRHVMETPGMCPGEYYHCKTNECEALR